MKVWLFGGSDIAESWPCVFASKRDAEAFLARYAKQELPEIARTFLNYALEEEEKTEPCGECNHQQEWDCCVTVDEAVKLTGLVEEATETDNVETWLLAFDYASKHDFEDLRAPSLESLMEVPIVTLEDRIGLISDGEKVDEIDLPRGFFVIGKTDSGHRVQLN